MEKLKELKFIILTFTYTLLVSCGGDTEDTINDITKCENLNGRTYYSKILFKSNDLPQKILEQNEVFRFSNDHFTSSLINKDRDGTYECQNGEIIATFNSGYKEKMVFTEDMESFTFYISEYDESHTDDAIEIRYFHAESGISPAPEKCEHVKGERYENYSENIYLNFGKDQGVQIRQDGTSNDSAIAVCDLGELYIHRSVYDIDPILIKIDEANNSITADINGQQVQLTKYIFNCNLTPGIPVCAVELDSSKPRTYQTIVAACVTEGYIMAFDGHCNEFEGRQVIEPLEICTESGTTVCAIEASTKPCDSVPCPSMRYRTFRSSCLARAYGARVNDLAPCDSLQGKPVYDLIGACPHSTGPVCAKDEVTTDCTSEDCPLHQYKTFSNQCFADLALAPRMFPGSCGELENTLTNSAPAIIMSSELPEDTMSPTVSNVTIDADVLSLELSYSDCESQYFELHISTSIAESNPIQVAAVFKPSVIDGCSLEISSSHRFDLSPLKHFLQQLSGELNGRVTIQGIGTYEY